MTSEEITSSEERAIQEASAASGYTSLSLASMALVAAKYQGDAAALSAIQPIYGRSPRYMAWAVGLWPSYFEPAVAETLEPDFFNCLFACARLPHDEALTMEERVRAESLRAYQVNAEIKARGKAMQAQLKAKWNMLHIYKVFLSVENQGRFTALTVYIETPKGKVKEQLEELDEQEINVRFYRYTPRGRKLGSGTGRKGPKPYAKKKAEDWTGLRPRKAKGSTAEARPDDGGTGGTEQAEQPPHLQDTERPDASGH